MTSPSSEPVLICGGAGFIGCNLAARLLSMGQPVLILDDLSRGGVDGNLEWLRKEFGRLLEFELADIRDVRALRRCVRNASAVFHLAGQTAVTTSLVAPREDFEINVAGTLGLLEELRALAVPVPLVFTSTNKVYGNLDGLPLRREDRRYQPEEKHIVANAIDERCPLSFHSPYGCSKGAADQYVLDYSRSFGLPNVVFRMSCIYGPHQCGTEDQGWVAHFLLRAIAGQPITLFGDGMQVRDVLFVEDLVDAFLLANRNAARLAGQAFNIGGGPQHTTSLLELLELIGDLQGRMPAISFEDWRAGDQRYYVSDVRAFYSSTGWRPTVSVREGVSRLHEWLIRHGARAGAALQGGGR